MVPSDATDARAWQGVLINLHSLGRVLQRLPGYSGPTLGAKPAAQTRRNFSPAQLVKTTSTPQLAMRNAMIFDDLRQREADANERREDVQDVPELQGHDASPQRDSHVPVLQREGLATERDQDADGLGRRLRDLRCLHD